MRTNIEIDDELMKKALKYSKLKTKKEIINEALNEYLKTLLLSIRWTPPVIVLPVIMQEVLQGIENNKHYDVIKENLQGFEYIQYGPYEFSIKAAEIYRSLRL